MERKEIDNVEFVIERDRRLRIIKEQSLWQLLRERVLINGKPIAHRTARDVFNRKTFEEVDEGTPYRVWIASKGIVDEYEANRMKYGSRNQEMESPTTD